MSSWEHNNKVNDAISVEKREQVIYFSHSRIFQTKSRASMLRVLQPIFKFIFCSQG